MKLFINAYVYFFVYVQTVFLSVLLLKYQSSNNTCVWIFVFFQALSAVVLMAKKAKKSYIMLYYIISYILYLDIFWLK